MNGSRWAGTFFVPVLLGALAGCNLLGAIRVPTSSEPSAEETEKQASEAETGGAASAASAAIPARATEWFAACSTEFDELTKRWKKTDDETKKLIADQKDKGFYEAYPTLLGQTWKVGPETRKLLGGAAADFAYRSGTGLELLLAIAELQVATGHAYDVPFDPRRESYRASYPLTGDVEFDRATYCAWASPRGTISSLGGIGSLQSLQYDGKRSRTPWMTLDEERAFRARAEKLVKKTNQTLDALEKLHQSWNNRVGGDYGVVKSAQKQPDGSVLVKGKALDTPYSCAHTGQWRWNGVAYTDCDYVDGPSRETYAFTATFKDLPKGGLKPGDKINFYGENPSGTPHDRENTAWNGLVLRQLFRGGKMLYEGDMSEHVDRQY